MAITRELLSGSTNGRPIKVVATATPGTTIHTATSGTSNKDEIWAWAHNSSGSDVALTIEFGGTTSPDDLIKVTVPSLDGAMLVIPGLNLNNSLVVRAFAGTTNVITVSGYVNRIAP